MTTAIFGLIGVETVAITAAENKDLRTEETVKIATRKICLRLTVLYTLATFTVGLNVPYTYPTIKYPAVIAFGYGQHSAFVISAVLNRSEEHTSELQSHSDLVCRLLLEKKKII